MLDILGNLIQVRLRFQILIRSRLKKVFSPELGVEPLSQVLDILEYACGWRFGLALISDKNPNFEIVSSDLWMSQTPNYVPK